MEFWFHFDHLNGRISGFLKQSDLNGWPLKRNVCSVSTKPCQVLICATPWSHKTGTGLTPVGVIGQTARRALWFTRIDPTIGYTISLIDEISGRSTDLKSMSSDSKYFNWYNDWCFVLRKRYTRLCDLCSTSRSNSRAPLPSPAPLPASGCESGLGKIFLKCI